MAPPSAAPLWVTSTSTTGSVPNAGQEMFVELKVDGTNGDGTAYFNILPPGSDGVAIYNGSASADGTARIRLPEDGTYTIRVYLMGNDRDTDKTVGYNVDISIQ
jgi:hypothetical protein